jgi:hypothetical protein
MRHWTGPVRRGLGELWHLLGNLLQLQLVVLQGIRMT